MKFSYSSLKYVFDYIYQGSHLSTKMKVDVFDVSLYGSVKYQPTGNVSCYIHMKYFLFVANF
jgi:hypothetical protein